MKLSTCGAIKAQKPDSASFTSQIRGAGWQSPTISGMASNMLSFADFQLYHENFAFCIASYTFIAVGAVSVLAPREASALVVVNAI